MGVTAAGATHLCQGGLDAALPRLRRSKDGEIIVLRHQRTQKSRWCMISGLGRPHTAPTGP